MDCYEVRDLIDSFLSEQLLVETNHEVLRHLESCPSCRAEIDAGSVLRTATRRAFANTQEFRISDQFREAALARAREAAHTGIPYRMMRRRWTLGFAVAAALVIAGGLFQLLHTSGINAIARDAVGDHRNCAVQFRLPQKPISLEDAAAHYDPSYRLLRDVPSDDWDSPIGQMHVVDRHSCVFRGRRFAHIVFQFEGQMVSLLITANDGKSVELGNSQDNALHLTDRPSEEGFQVVSFEIPGHIAFIVGNLQERQLRQVAQSLSGPLYSQFARG